MVIFFNFSPTSSHLHPLQVENCDSNSRLVVDEDDNGKLGLERVNRTLHVHSLSLNPLNPHDAAKHHFTFLKNALISYTWGF